MAADRRLERNRKSARKEPELIALLQPAVDAPVLDDGPDPLSWLRKPPDSQTAADPQLVAKAEAGPGGSFGTDDTNSGSKSSVAFTIVVDAAPPMQKPATASATTASPPPSGRALQKSPKQRRRPRHPCLQAGGPGHERDAANAQHAERHVIVWTASYFGLRKPNSPLTTSTALLVRPLA